MLRPNVRRRKVGVCYIPTARFIHRCRASSKGRRSAFHRIARTMSPLTRTLLVLLYLSASARLQPVGAQPVANESPYALARLRAGEPAWAPLLRLRAAASRFAPDSARGEGSRTSAEEQAWLQLLAQAEATFGNPQRALEAWDRLGRPFTGDLTPYRTRYGTARQVSAFDTIVAMADTARVIMVNERHHAAEDRLLTLRLLRALRAKGYRYFAAEAFAVDTSLPMRGYVLDDGSYLSEPLFAETVREALRLGYTLVPYEASERQFKEPDSLTPQQRRDWGQAQNLVARTLAVDSQARVLVHAGFDHIKQRARANWSPMAAYFVQLTGIDPVTVDQTNATARSRPETSHPVHQALRGRLPTDGTIFMSDSSGESIGASALAVDFVVVRAAAPDIAERPSYMTMNGLRRAVRVSVPECRRVNCVVTAHRAAEPDEAAVLDRVEVAQRDTATLFLPTEDVRVSVYAHDGQRLRSWTVPRPR